MNYGYDAMYEYWCIDYFLKHAFEQRFIWNIFSLENKMSFMEDFAFTNGHNNCHICCPILKMPFWIVTWWTFITDACSLCIDVVWWPHRLEFNNIRIFKIVWQSGQPLMSLSACLKRTPGHVTLEHGKWYDIRKGILLQGHLWSL